MPSFRELSATYATRINNALSMDGFTKYASFDQYSLLGSRTVNVLKSIEIEMEAVWNIDGKSRKFTDDEKDEIFRGIGEDLGLTDSDTIKRSIKAASNDSFMSLLVYINQITNNKKK